MPSNKTPLSETTDNALADFPALQDLFEQADEDLRAFYEALSVRLNDYALIDGALSASPAAGPQIRRFLELLDRDVAAFRRAEPAATALSLRALYGRRIGAVGGGVSCGKTAFINSLLTNASCRLAEDEQPVTVLPCHVIAGSDVEKAVARGVSRWGGIFEMPVETCLNLSYSALRSRDFSLLKIMRGMTLLTPVRDRLFRHLCLMDTPGYNPPETYGEADARNTALDAVSKADFLIWLVDAASGTPLPASDIDFLSGTDFGREDGKPLFIVAARADLRKKDALEDMLAALEDSLDDAGLYYEGICAWSSREPKGIFPFRKSNVRDFLKEQNQAPRRRERLADELRLAFRPCIDAINADCDARETTCGSVRDVFLQALEHGASGTDARKIADCLNELSSHFLGPESREARLRRAEDMQASLLRCLKKCCDSLDKMPGDGDAPQQQSAAGTARRQRKAAAQNSLRNDIMDEAPQSPGVSEENRAAPQSADDGRQRLEQAAAQGDADACYALGIMYDTGESMPKDYKKARRCYEQAAARGHAGAQAVLGEIYYYGKGIPRDYDRARELCEQSAAQGDARGLYMLGRMYENGRGVAQDTGRACRLYQKAAAQGHGSALRRLDQLMEEGEADAFYGLGALCSDSRSMTPDYETARQHYLKAAEKQHAGALFQLGNMYYYGRGVAQDYDTAREYYEQAAARGDGRARCALGFMYDTGESVEQDYDTAREYYEQAAAQGDAIALCNLGDMYEFGFGVSQDYDTARQWYEKAAAQGHAGAQSDLKRLK